MDANRKKFIEKIADDAISATLGTGLFPSLLIAQACLEGANGTSQLAKLHNNHFGIKASGGWSGAVAKFLTYEYIKGIKTQVYALFRSYKNLYSGFADRCTFLIENKRYRQNGVFEAKSPEEQAAALQKAGYATDPNYAKLLSDIIRIYDLKKYDAVAIKKKSLFNGSYAFDLLKRLGS